MITKHFLGIFPETGTNPGEQLQACLSSLDRKLNSLSINKSSVLKQTLFIKAADLHNFLILRTQFETALTTFYGHPGPPTSFVGQPPQDDKIVSLEVIVPARFSSSAQIIYKSQGNIRYLVFDSGTGKEVYAAGITGNTEKTETAEQATAVFTSMAGILKQENLTFSHIVRQWNYIEDIVGTHKESENLKQNYQQFNDVRTLYYNQADFNHGYPAATGIGMNTGGVIIDFIALHPTAEQTILPLSNPRQIDAHRYSQEVLVGRALSRVPQKGTPKFERAKLVKSPDGGCIYISGTAAIVGQKHSLRETAREQTLTTLDNIAQLISRENLERSGYSISYLPKPAYLRVYVKKPSDLPAVQQACLDHQGEIPTLYVISDICRSELLVEIEGIVNLNSY